MNDERAQALTEFVIAIPLVLFVFMLIMQYFLLVQVAQIGNYAAFVAARVYAVRASIDEADAMDKARTAAALVYAPVSGYSPGEVAGVDLGGLTKIVPSGAPDVLEGVASLAEGYALAYYWRLDEYATGGNMTVTNRGDPAQVEVEINYAFPITMPGLAGMWKIVGGDKSMGATLKPMRRGLTDYTIDLGVTEVIVPRPWLKYPYVNVRSKCAIGYEDWGGDINMYRPRKRKTVEDAAATDPSLEQQAIAMKNAQKKYEAAFVRLQKEHEEYLSAAQVYTEAQSEYEAIKVDPAATDDQKAAAWRKMNETREKRDDEYNDYKHAKMAYDRAVDDLAHKTGTDYS